MFAFVKKAGVTPPIPANPKRRRQKSKIQEINFGGASGGTEIYFPLSFDDEVVLNESKNKKLMSAWMPGV